MVCKSQGQDIISLFDDILPFGKGFLVMLHCYLDRGEKSDHSDGVMSIASVIFKPTPYKQFVRPWNRMLKAWGASAFHATDFYNGAGEFKRDTPERRRLFENDSKRIPNLIGRSVKHILIVSFRPEEFDQVAPPRWKESFGTSVHSHAVQLALIVNGYWREDHYRSESFAYVMESGDPDEGEVSGTVEKMRKDYESGTARVIKVSSFTTVNKGVARGLEAADFAAWQWNKYYMDKIRTGNENSSRKDFAAMVSAARERVEYIFATGEKLKFFFSVGPPDVVGAAKQ